MSASLLAASCGGASGNGGGEQGARPEAVPRPDPSLASAPGRVVAAPPDAPNVVVVVTDDQTLASLSRRTMPRVTRLLAEEGTRFRNAIVTTPLCCPARATFITGQYTHNNGVLSNRLGYPALANPRNTLPLWLHRAGYTTVHLGKYLNKYEQTIGDLSEVATGWDEWHTLLAPRRYYDYALHVNGGSVDYGGAPEDHLTRVLNRRATRIVERLAPRERPFYLQLDHYAPHTGPRKQGGRCAGAAVPEPGDLARFRDEPLPRPPSFDEADVTDKPSFVRARERLGRRAREELEVAYRCALASLAGVDRGVGSIYAALRRAGELENTAVVFTSDNGLFYGEHRVPGSKKLPYEEAIRVPLVLRVPARFRGGEPPVRRVSEPVANIDIAPTILDLAGANPCKADGECRVMDGRSLLPLLGPAPEWPRSRAIVVELNEGTSELRPTLPCSYSGVRVPGWIYVEYGSVPDPDTEHCEASGQRELYDLRRDPLELENRGPGGRRELRLATLLDRLRGCSGIEDRDPKPVGGSYCE